MLTSICSFSIQNNILSFWLAWHGLCLTSKINSEFAMSISLLASLGPALTSLISPSKSSSPLPSATSSLAAKPAETAAQKFMDYANMTPAQRLQAQMMSQLGITEDQFKAMSPADQAKVMDKIRDMIKQQAQNSSTPRSGLITDMSV
jgi:hypothetical protein